MIRLELTITTNKNITITPDSKKNETNVATRFINSVNLRVRMMVLLAGVSQRRRITINICSMATNMMVIKINSCCKFCRLGNQVDHCPNQAGMKKKMHKQYKAEMIELLKR